MTSKPQHILNQPCLLPAPLPLPRLTQQSVRLTDVEHSCSPAAVLVMLAAKAVTVVAMLVLCS
jgi:hypothetical protein